MIMDWNECERKYLRKVEVDLPKIDSIKNTAEKRVKFIEQKPINKDNISFIIEGYYEVIKELLTALLLKKGLRSKNHQCLISYFYKNYPDYEAEAYSIQQLSYKRNRLNYYGELIEPEFYNKNKENFKKIIKILNKLIENNLNQ